MTDQTPTPEQIAAWQRIKACGDSAVSSRDVALVAPLLPKALTNPQPALPEEHGEYHDADGDLWWLDSGGWHTANGFWPERAAHQVAPFTRLVPERPPITRELVAAAIEAADMRGTGQSFIDVAHKVLMNGTDR